MTDGADLVRLTISPNEPAAEEIRSFLRTEGIESMLRKTDFAAGATDASQSGLGAREILVHASDFEAARALIADG